MKPNYQLGSQCGAQAAHAVDGIPPLRAGPPNS